MSKRKHVAAITILEGARGGEGRRSSFRGTVARESARVVLESHSADRLE